LEQLKEEVVGEEIFLKEGQVACLGMRELGAKMVGLGLHNGEVWFPNQVGQVSIHNSSTMIAWTKREGAKDTADA